MTLTDKELNLLNEIKKYTSQSESGYSEFLSTSALSRSNAGVISSLEKKGMIYNSYSNMTNEDWINFNGKKTKAFKMWCLTPDAWEMHNEDANYMELVRAAIKGYVKNYK